MRKVFILIGSIVLSAALYGCSSSSDLMSGPTRSSEEVFATAQARAELTREATFETPPPTPVTPSATAPLVTSTPADTLTPTPSQPIVTADYNAFVRSGPDESYENIDFLLEGQSGVVTARYENEVNGRWYLIERIEQGKDGWIWSGAVTLAGDVSGVNVVTQLP
ncbi:MAG: SH3 domain-containing protein [Anaerolineales bacterium]|jgi:uncharacterized protein YgiM (DUF1202 family)